MANYTTDLCINASNAIESGHHSDREAARAFDGLPGGWGTNAWDAPRDGTDRWVGYDFVTNTRINKIRIQGVSGTINYYIIDFNIDGWNGTAWINISTITGESAWLENEWRDYIITPTQSYSKYRIFIVTSGSNNIDCSIAEIEMMAKVEANPNRSDNISELYHKKQMVLRGKAAEGFIRPTIAEFFTSKDFVEIIPPAYAVWDSENFGIESDGSITFSNEGKTAIINKICSSASTSASMNTGKYYWEFTMNSTAGSLLIGIAEYDHVFNGNEFMTQGVAHFYGNERVINGNRTTIPFNFDHNAVIALRYDADNKTLSLYENNILGHGPWDVSALTKDVIPFVGCGASSTLNAQITIITDPELMTYAVPDGYETVKE